MAWWWWILPGLIGVIGLATLLGAVGALLRLRLISGVVGFLGGAAFLAVAAAVALLGMDLQTYSRLTSERPIATLVTHQKGPQLYDAVVTELAPAGKQPAARTYQIHGDEWRIEARVLKWKPWANVLGLDTQYRLDRLSGRYIDTQSELTAPRSVYDLRPTASSPLDLWLLARRYGKYAPVVDTLYGSGASMPMAEGASYEVWITQNGLVARPSNPAALDASGAGWH